jgi:hypothetical protein
MKVVVVLIALLSALVVIPGAAIADGNADAAHACQHDGYVALVGGTSEAPDASVTFNNAGECASYAAHGGTLWQPGSSTTARIDATLPEWQDSGVNIPANSAAVISVVNDGNATCSTGGFDCAFFSQLWGPCGGICFVDGVNFYAVAGRVAGGAGFTLWLPFESTNPPVAASGPGELYLVFNEQVSGWPPPLYGYFDNAGYLTATITTYGRVN